MGGLLEFFWVSNFIRLNNYNIKKINILELVIKNIEILLYLKT